MGKVFAAGIAAIFVKGLSETPRFLGTVAEVGENGVRSRSAFVGIIGSSFTTS